MGTKKILFSLEMSNGEKVHTLEELKEKFDICRVLEYADSGQLVRWLRDRGANDMAEKIESLDNVSEKYARGVCEAILDEMDEETLRQIVEAKEQKEKAEKEAVERLKIEAEKAEEESGLLAETIEERDEQSPNLLVKGGTICVVEENRLIACKEESGIGLFFEKRFCEGYGVVQEAEDAYYLREQHDIYFLCRMKLMTQEEEEICEIDKSELLGVRNHKLFYKNTSCGQFLEIGELDLNTRQKRLHIIESPFHLFFPINLIEKRAYPCIDEDGRHMYCRASLVIDRYYMKEKACVVEIDLGNDTISELISTDQFFWGDSSGHAYWGTGRFSFLVHDVISDKWVGSNEGRIVLDSKCIYYDVNTRELCRLDKLEEAIHSFAERSYHYVFKICCGEGRIYWLASIEESSMGGLRHIKEIQIMEYDIATGTSSQKAHLNCKHWAKDFASQMDVFVSNNYLYIYNYGRSLNIYDCICTFEPCESWRYPLDTWKVERLVKNGSEYKYVQ